MSGSTRLTVTVLGRTLLDVRYGPDAQEQPPVPAAAVPAETDDVGPVTDRRSPPTLGFAPPVPRARRAGVGDRPVIR